MFSIFLKLEQKIFIMLKNCLPKLKSTNFASPNLCGRETVLMIPFPD